MFLNMSLNKQLLQTAHSNNVVPNATTNIAKNAVSQIILTHSIPSPTPQILSGVGVPGQNPGQVDKA